MKKRIKKSMYVLWSQVKENKPFWLTGLLFFMLLFIISGIMNSSLSYMGNSSDEIASVIIKQFWPVILYQVIKVLIVYAFIGIIFNFIYYSTLLFISRRFSFFNSVKIRSLIVVIFMCFSFLMLFFRGLIINPQLYIENFAQKLTIFENFQYYLTDNFDPFVFTLIFLITNSVFIIILFYSLNFRRKIKKIFFFLHKMFFHIKRKYIYISCAVIFLIFSFFVIKIIIEPRPDKKNIIIISSDALRPDRFSANGYKRKLTPNIDKLIKNGVQFRGVITAVPRTFPSWVSCLSSSYPLKHEIRHMFPRTRERSVKINTAVENLKEKGYYTSVVSDFAGDIFPRIDLGFDHIKAPNLNFNILIKQIILEKQTALMPFILNGFGRIVFPEVRGIVKFSDPELLSQETISEIENAGNKPFFITSFYSITHFPFSAPYPYYKKYSDKNYRGPYKYYKQVVVKLGKGDNKNAEGSVELTKKDKQQVNDLYDGCLNHFDKQVGIIYKYLKSKKLLDNTIFVIYSDHGENLYEYDYGMGHGEHLKGNLALEVPFVIVDKDMDLLNGSTINKPSSIIDVMPTIFDIAKIKRPDFFEGISLISDEKPFMDVSSYVETGIWFDDNKRSKLFFQHNRIDYPDISGISEIDFSYNNEGVIKQPYQNIINFSKYRAIYSNEYKLIYMPMESGVKYELYNNEEDPTNMDNLILKKPKVFKIMKKKLFNFLYEKSNGNFLELNGYVIPFFSDPVF